MESGALYPEMEEEEHMSLFDLEISYRKNAGKCVGVLVVVHFLAASHARAQTVLHFPTLCPQICVRCMRP